MPLERFDAAGSLAELAQLLNPAAHLNMFSIKQVGVNGNAWILSCIGRQEGWLLKQVAAHRRFSGVPTEVESCESLLRRFPGLLQDPRLAFPHSVVNLQVQGGEHVGDLLIARQAPGVQLGRFLAELDLRNPVDQQKLDSVCSGVGELLADFHARYEDPITGEATHHTDFHPSNILFDEKTGALSIVDLTGMGSFGINDDVEKFGSLIAKMGGERYAVAFRLRYIALAKRDHSALSRSARSTAASSADLGLLYPPGLGTNQHANFSETSFATLSALLVPATGFQPERSLTTIAYLLSPGKKLANPVIEPFGSSGKAWTLWVADGPEFWILQEVSCERESDLRTAAERCEELLRRRPEVLKDLNLAFPHCVIPLQVNLQHSADLLVSRSSCRGTLEQYIRSLDLKKPANLAKLRQVVHKVGQMIAILKAKYSVDKGQLSSIQFQPGLALYDEAADQVCFAYSAGEHCELQRLRNQINKLAGRSVGEVLQRAHDVTKPRPRRPSRDAGLLHALTCGSEDDDASSSGSDSETNVRESCSMM